MIRCQDGLTTDLDDSANNGAQSKSTAYGSLYHAHLHIVSTYPDQGPVLEGTIPHHQTHNRFTLPNYEDDLTEVGEEHHCLATFLKMFWGLEACRVQLLFTGEHYLRWHASHKIMGWLSTERQRQICKTYHCGNSSL